MFSAAELQVLISGDEKMIDIDDMRIYAKYSPGYDENSLPIQLFWRAVESFDDKHRRLYDLA